jgi:hypothetical protein
MIGPAERLWGVQQPEAIKLFQGKNDNFQTNQITLMLQLQEKSS